jgi:hypothetical protein
MKLWKTQYDLSREKKIDLSEGPFFKFLDILAVLRKNLFEIV